MHVECCTCTSIGYTKSGTCVVLIIIILSCSTTTEQETVQMRQEYATKKAEMLEKTKLVFIIN